MTVQRWPKIIPTRYTNKYILTLLLYYCTVVDDYKLLAN